MPATVRSFFLRPVAVSLIVVIGWCVPSIATAQDDRDPPFLANLAKQIVFDPTTYGPAIVAYDATMRDWNTSQPFFENGFLERNARFTITGLPNDLPLTEEAGRRVILKDALVHLQLSAVHNATSRTLERMLLDRFPEKRTLIRVLGWVERAAFASYLGYELSHKHYRQARENERLAREYGFR